MLPTPPTPSPWRTLTALSLFAIMALAVQMRFPYLNGPWYYTWIWQRIDPATYWPCAAIASLPLFLALYLFDRTHARRRDWPLFLCCLSLIFLTLLTSYLQPRMPGWERTIRIVRSPGATSYFTAANQYFAQQGMSLRDFLRHYPTLQPHFFLHAQTKPPGPILYYALWVKTFGPGMGTALAAGLALLALTCTSVYATSWMVRTVTDDPRAGLYAAAALVCCPSTIVFYPGFDSVYPAIACLMTGTWVCAVRTRHAKWALAFGACLAAALFTTYVLLLLGAFLGLYSLLALRLVPHFTLPKLLRQSALALAAVLVIYLLLYLTTGYSPIAAYHESRHLLTEALRWVRRPYPSTIYWDLYDFALGLGYVPVVIVLLYVTRRDIPRELRALGVLALVQPVIVAVSYLVPGETSRCWQILIPLLLIPVGAELARWDPPSRLAYYLGALAVLVAIAGRLSFINTEPLDKLIEMHLL